MPFRVLRNRPGTQYVVPIVDGWDLETVDGRGAFGQHTEIKSINMMEWLVHSSWGKHIRSIADIKSIRNRVQRDGFSVIA